MVRIIPSKEFEKNVRRADFSLREKLEKQIQKIISNPEIGKPLKYRRGERTIYVKPYRLIYSFFNDTIYLLKFEHRKSVYER